MNEIVSTAAAKAISSFYPDHPDPPPSFTPTGTAADTAFSGSAVLELRLEPPPAPPNKPLVVLKHSVVRTRNLEDPSDKSKLKAAQKVDSSSVNEYAFLTAYPTSALGPKIRIPETLYARNDPNDGVTLLMESFSTHSQIPVIPLGVQLTSALRWLAYFHASFLPSGPLDPDKIIELGGWELGTHLSLEKRPQDEVQRLPADIAAFCDRFEGMDPYFSAEPAKGQGLRLLKIAPAAAAYLHPTNHPHKTICHGDYKQGNFFFDEQGEICVFDWQWTGPGLGATDLIYLCAMAVSDETLTDHEANIIRPYHAFLIGALNNDATKYPYEDLLTEFKIAALDYQRWQGGSRLKSMTPETMRKAKLNVDVNHGIFRRSIERVKWVFQTVNAALDEVEAGTLSIVR